MLVRREASFTGSLDWQVLKVLLGQLLILIQALLHFLCTLLVSFIKVFFVFFKQLFVQILCQMRRSMLFNIPICAKRKEEELRANTYLTQDLVYPPGFLLPKKLQI